MNEVKISPRGTRAQDSSIPSATNMSNAQREREISRPFISTTNSASPHRQSLAVRIANTLLTLRPPPLSPTPSPPTKPPPSNAITLVCISDTHNAQPSLPAGDILLHAGDLSSYDTFAEVQAQLTWLNSQPHKHKGVIAGNHDLLLDSAFVEARPWHLLENGKLGPGRGKGELDWGGVTYLENSFTEVVVRGRMVRVYGSPYVPDCGSFAFQYPSHSEDFWKGTVPEGTDLVLAHTPRALYVDGGEGVSAPLEGGEEGEWWWFVGISTMLAGEWRWI